MLRDVNWGRALAGGLLWSLAYNLAWAVAWFAFMRREWSAAFAAVGRPMLWAPDFWTFWVVITIPVGIAMAAYAAVPSASGSPRRASLGASLGLWLIMTLGFIGWGVGASLPARVMALDSVVNLAALLAASLAVLPASHRPAATAR